jgi:hypothetical protein
MAVDARQLFNKLFRVIYYRGKIIGLHVGAVDNMLDLIGITRPSISNVPGHERSP